jgi:hypothetical protein
MVSWSRVGTMSMTLSPFPITPPIEKIERPTTWPE